MRNIAIEIATVVHHAVLACKGVRMRLERPVHELGDAADELAVLLDGVRVIGGQ